MTNQQLYLAIGLPTLTSLITLILVCLAWLSGRSSDKEFRNEIRHDLRELRTEIQRLETRFEERFDRIDVELRYFHGVTGAHEARLTLLEKK